MSTAVSVQKEQHEPRFSETVGLVASREIMSRLRSKAFVISTLVLMLAVLASVVIGSLVSANQEPPKVAVVGEASDAVAATGLRSEPAADLDAAEQLLRDGDVDAIVAPTALVESSGLLDDATTVTSGADASQAASSAAFDVTVVGIDQAPRSVVQALAITPPFAVLDPAPADPLLAYFVALGFGIVFFFSAITFGSTIAQSVVEEKQTRIIEILLSAVSARALLTGKVIGNSVMAFGQIIAIAALAILGLAVTGQRVLLGGLGPSVVWFVVFFAIGFVMLAALFAATAATVSRAEDVGNVTTPVTMLVMIPYFLVVFLNDNPTVLTIMSYVPFSAPIGMPVRIFLEQAEWWEPILSLVILIATTVLAVLIGERMYRNSLLRTGARVKFSEALRG
ncbi:ABC transporter permease [Agromyces intestinalis]|uniref:ABC transporter permease n=1 Tax=Agromyces intestinalis TaxID=2592652 RepID=A0A5C1YHU3_9MICO|nr:ABC transporter permease [Agromyces intestinalis]QEO14669.1 ABC transporter permease [Agromyces intestinalis]